MSYFFLRRSGAAKSKSIGENADTKQPLELDDEDGETDGEDVGAVVGATVGETVGETDFVAEATS